MNPQIISLAISNTGAVIVFILLLIITGIIGYVTSWLYAKSVYKPIIKQLEDEKAALNKQVDDLKKDVNRLNSNIEELNKKIVDLEEKVKKKEAEITKLKESIKDE